MAHNERDRYMIGNFYSFSTKLQSKRYTTKSHKVGNVEFYDIGFFVTLRVHSDERAQRIKFTLDEAKGLLEELTHSIKIVESKNQSA